MRDNRLLERNLNKEIAPRWRTRILVRILICFAFHSELVRGKDWGGDLERRAENKLSKLIISFCPRRVRPSRISPEAVKACSLAFRFRRRKIVRSKCEVLLRLKQTAATSTSRGIYATEKYSSLSCRPDCQMNRDIKLGFLALKIEDAIHIVRREILQTSRELRCSVRAQIGFNWPSLGTNCGMFWKY